MIVQSSSASFRVKKWDAGIRKAVAKEILHFKMELFGKLDYDGG
jgi:hypothetical protein